MVKGFTISTLIILSISVGYSQQHPGLLLTKESVVELRQGVEKFPLLKTSYLEAKAEVDAAMSRPISVPIPKDLPGGFTHEQHKNNFLMLQKAGVVFQISNDEKYAKWIKDVLLTYAAIYPTFDKHPATRSYAPGKFFWQCLNDANWLVYVSQAYDCIYDWLDKKTVNKLNKELFRPYAEYISIQNPQFFNRIHNHSTWGNAAVGMIGLVMDDKELIDWALNGLKIKVPGDIVKDNDGGAIQLKGQTEAGFFAQLDHSFSPDGYYTEGPYYQRYAMYPFLIFAEALANKKPELGILEYRNGLLIKAVFALVDQTNAAGEFFPINDSQKGMSLASRELVNALSMAYHYGGKNPQLLSLIQEQGRVPLTTSGLSAAKDIAAGLAKPYIFNSMELTDGANGDEGAIGIIRSKDLTLMMKYTKHGMGHGHFDRLSFLLYNGADEVIQDYGAARWVNIEHKDGGGYLKENNTWAKQTVAHNTLVVNKTSQFMGKVDDADKTSGTAYYFNAKNANVQIVSAKETNAYAGVAMQRTMAVLNIDGIENPLVLDLFNIQADKEESYDLPLYYMGELMSTNQKYTTNNTLTPMGENSGYQHLWTEAQGSMTGNLMQMTWFNKGKFYTMTSTVKAGDEMLLTRIGGNAPNYALRRDPGFIHRRKAGNTLFANLYERHGFYSRSDEIPVNSFTSITDLTVLHESADYVVVQFELKNGDKYRFAFSMNNKDEKTKHKVQIGNELIEWMGVSQFLKK
ncbi:MAG: alginate lyase family protein [Flammeovirgaceae bacterium]|nr:alginate lyase family protein [Flammeovirgaceae bacterium]